MATLVRCWLLSPWNSNISESVQVLPAVKLQQYNNAMLGSVQYIEACIEALVIKDIKWHTEHKQ